MGRTIPLKASQKVHGKKNKTPVQSPEKKRPSNQDLPLPTFNNFFCALYFNMLPNIQHDNIPITPYPVKILKILVHPYSTHSVRGHSHIT